MTERRRPASSVRPGFAREDWNARYAGSELAAALLSDWESAVTEFWHVRPRSDVAAIEDEHEGTGGRAAEEAEEATAG